MTQFTNSTASLSLKEFKNQLLSDYKLVTLSRECSLLGRKEVLSGKAKFGIFGDGKELPQLAWSKVFKKGDHRSGYYRDQTVMMALELLSAKQIFHALYATTDLNLEPMSAGRQMGGHFLTPFLDENGNWLNQNEQYNISSDISCTGGQMPRLLGLAQASQLYRKNEFSNASHFSTNGNEIAWGTIGNASTSEGLFLEVFNAGGVLQVPMVISVWDDEYGISVPNSLHTTKSNISKALSGFQKEEGLEGYQIFEVKGWDYPALIETYQKAEQIARTEHIPILIHVTELTQPIGHSTSGSHERYKSQERLSWEQQYDCNLGFKNWIIESGLATKEELDAIEQSSKEEAKEAKNEAWKEYTTPLLEERDRLIAILDNLRSNSNEDFINDKIKRLKMKTYVLKRSLLDIAYQVKRESSHLYFSNMHQLNDWLHAYEAKEQNNYSSELIEQSSTNALEIKEEAPIYGEDSKMVDGRIIIRDNFDALCSSYDNLLIFGEDCGKIGDVNQGLEGLQEKYGADRISDTSIREASIVGQGIGLALRGFRPIAEIQYLDYILYAANVLSDDLATLRYRSVGQQKAPLIIRTRGHRLEGIWHSGSHMGALIHLLRGVYILAPRNMTQAAGLYNTLLETGEPALLIESLNGYRIKEKKPDNLGSFKFQIGKIERIKEGTDITVVSYGSTLRIVQKVCKELERHHISVELIDAQTLWPFDKKGETVESVKKTNRLLVIDEDVPGGCSAYLLQEIIERQGGFKYLDSAPQTLSSKEHRPAYGSDGDYFSKPNYNSIFDKIYGMMHELNPQKYPLL